MYERTSFTTHLNHNVCSSFSASHLLSIIHLYQGQRAMKKLPLILILSLAGCFGVYSFKPVSSMNDSQLQQEYLDIQSKIEMKQVQSDFGFRKIAPRQPGYIGNSAANARAAGIIMSRLIGVSAVADIHKLQTRQNTLALELSSRGLYGMPTSSEKKAENTGGFEELDYDNILTECIDEAPIGSGDDNILTKGIDEGAIGSGFDNFSTTGKVLGGTTFQNFSDGTSGTSTNLGGTTFHNFSNGTSGTSTNLGGTTFHNFNGTSGTSTNIGGY